MVVDVSLPRMLKGKVAVGTVSVGHGSVIVPVTMSGGQMLPAAYSLMRIVSVVSYVDVLVLVKQAFMRMANDLYCSLNAP